MPQSTPKPQRKSVNIPVQSRLIEEAKELGINISRAAEESIANAVAAEKVAPLASGKQGSDRELE